MFDLRPYFVMIHSQSGLSVTPLTDAEGETMMFADITEANDAAEQNEMAVAFGWDVFMIGDGVEE